MHKDRSVDIGRLLPTVALMMAVAAAPAGAVTGSGSVEFRFTSFNGPYSVNFGGFVQTGTVNGVTPDFVSTVPNGFGTSTYDVGVVGATVSGGTFPLTGMPTSSVTLVDAPDFPNPDFETIFSWTPATFSNVPLGTDFTLGTLNFQNGSWYGAGATSNLNVPTLLSFRVTTTSASGPQFNQTRNLRLIHTVNAPTNNDTTTLGGMEAAADWVTLFDVDNGITLNTFRVFDRNQTPPGFTNSGSVDLIGRFGSLNIVGFGNPVGGFLTADNNPLPPVPPGGGNPPAIPEPATWAMLIAGFGLTGAVARRRRAMAA